ncbi:MAG: sigma-54-dependent Fis family transcriptional regulator [Gammaproteobacteria bacterium]
MSRNATLSAASRRQAWDRFCATGATDHLGHLPSHVISSWLRSRDCGVDPGLRAVPIEREFVVEDDQSLQLRDAAGGVLRQLENEIGSSAMLVVLTDPSGIIMHRGGSRDMLKLADSIELVDGSNVAERVTGTNGCGSSLVVGDITPIDLYEHYCEGFFEWADVGSSLVHPATNQVLGAIDLIRWKQALTPELILLARATALNVQSELGRRDDVLRRRLVDEFYRRNRDHGTPEMAVDANGTVVAANEACERWLQLNRGRLTGVRIGDLARFGVAAEARARNVARTGDSAEFDLTTGRDRAVVAPMVLQHKPVGAIITIPTASRKTQRVGAKAQNWEARFAFRDIIGNDPDFRAILRLAARAAQTELPILVTGETGTGKELVAHAIHDASARAGQPFVTVNCGAIPEDLIASELFGYAKGAFTGASATGKIGKFALADGGTIFLDEITETSAAFQVALLRVLQDCEVVPVGADRPVPTDVRVIAASNRDVEDMIGSGAFRADLYYRLASVSLKLPALRERPGDIGLLAAHILEEGGYNVAIDCEARAALESYEWPGNVRELKMVLEGATLLSKKDLMTRADLPDRFVGSGSNAAQAFPVQARTLRDRERQVLIAAIEEHRGNIRQIANELGLARSSLYRKIAKFALEECLIAARRRS